MFFPAAFAALVTALLVAGAPLRLRQEGSDNNVVTPVDPVAGDACGFGLTADSLAVKVSPEQYGSLLAVSPNRADVLTDHAEGPLSTASSAPMSPTATLSTE
jgi:hypothetical protein